MKYGVLFFYQKIKMSSHEIFFLIYFSCKYNNFQFIAEVFEKFFGNIVVYITS